MRYIVYIILIGAMIGITFGVFSVWGWNGLVPDLVLLLVIVLSVVFETFDYLFVAIVGGFWLDIVYSLPIGSSIVPLALCGVGVSYLLRHWLFSDMRWYHFLLVIAAATILLKFWIWAYANSTYLLHWSNYGISWKQTLGHLPFNILANLIIAYPLYTLVEMFARSQLRWQKNRLRI